jgi:hypothetical protein
MHFCCSAAALLQFVSFPFRYEIEQGIGESLCGDAELKAALVLFLQGDRGGEAYHFRVYLESLKMLEHARLWVGELA